MKKLKNFLLLILVVLVVVSCEKTTSISENEKDLLPLKIGNTWEYDVSENHNDTLNTYTSTQTVVSDTIIENLRYSCIKNDIRGKINDINYTYFHKSDIGYYQGMILDNRFFKGLVIKFPANEGEEYDNDGVKYKFISKNTKVQTAVGNFDCYVFSFITPWEKSHSSEYIYKIAPGVGIVYSEINTIFLDNHKEKSVTRNLKSYNLK